MSATRENQLWAWLKKCKTEFKSDLSLDRVENSCMSGMSDVHGSLKRKASFWIELKTCALPSNPKTKIRPKFQPAQPGWIRKRLASGDRVFVLLQVGSGGKAKRFLLDGCYVPRLVNSGMTVEALEEAAVLPPIAFASEMIEACATWDFFI
jgi:hypothetical protein